MPNSRILGDLSNLPTLCCCLQDREMVGWNADGSRRDEIMLLGPGSLLRSFDFLRLFRAPMSSSVLSLWHAVGVELEDERPEGPLLLA